MKFYIVSMYYLETTFFSNGRISIGGYFGSSLQQIKVYIVGWDPLLKNIKNPGGEGCIPRRGASQEFIPPWLSMDG